MLSPKIVGKRSDGMAANFDIFHFAQNMNTCTQCT